MPGVNRAMVIVPVQLKGSDKDSQKPLLKHLYQPAVNSSISERQVCPLGFPSAIT